MPTDLLTKQKGRVPVIPCTAPDCALTFWRPPRCTEHQQHDDLGRSVIEYLGRVGYYNSARFERIKIAVINTDRVIGDDLCSRVKSSDRCRIKNL